MTPFQAPDPEMMKQYQRSQLRLAQAFQLFMLQIAHGSAPRKAIELIDEAMDTWSDYEDAHRIDLPGGGDIVSAMLGKFGELADTMSKRSAARTQDELYAVDPADITAASADYCERIVQRTIEQHGVRSNPQVIADVSQEAYFAGAAQMLRMLHGVTDQPFQYLHGDLGNLLQDYHLSPTPAQPEVSTLTPGPSQRQEDL